MEIYNNISTIHGPQIIQNNQTNFFDNLNQGVTYSFHLIPPSGHMLFLCVDTKERVKANHPYGDYWLCIVLCIVPQLRN